jgi:hypothetical protein
VDVVDARHPGLVIAFVVLDAEGDEHEALGLEARRRVEVCGHEHVRSTLP